MAHRTFFFYTNFFHLNISNISSFIGTKKIFTMCAGKFTLFHNYYLYNIEKEGIEFFVTFG